MDRALERAPDRLRGFERAPGLAVLRGEEDAVVDGRPHEDALHHELGEVVVGVALQPDRGDREEDPALNEEDEEGGNGQGEEGEGDDEEDRTRREEGNERHLRVEGLTHLVDEHGVPDETASSFEVFAVREESGDELLGPFGFDGERRGDDEPRVLRADELDERRRDPFARVFDGGARIGVDEGRKALIGEDPRGEHVDEFRDRQSLFRTVPRLRGVGEIGESDRRGVGLGADAVEEGGELCGREGRLLGSRVDDRPQAPEARRLFGGETARGFRRGEDRVDEECDRCLRAHPPRARVGVFRSAQERELARAQIGDPREGGEGRRRVGAPGDRVVDDPLEAFKFAPPARAHRIVDEDPDDFPRGVGALRGVLRRPHRVREGEDLRIESGGPGEVRERHRVRLHGG